MTLRPYLQYVVSMTATSTALFMSGLIQKMIDQVPAVAASFVRIIAGTLWISFQPYLPYAIGALFILLVIASINALLGRTGMLGSLLYHISYFAILATVIWIKGWEILFNTYFDLVCFVVYRLCYWMTGLVIAKFKARV